MCSEIAMTFDMFQAKVRSAFVVCIAQRPRCAFAAKASDVHISLEDVLVGRQAIDSNMLARLGTKSNRVQGLQ